jgi:hypothetical protein
MERLSVAIEPDLVEALRRIGRREGASLTVLINLALKEFLGSMEDDFELDGVRTDRARQPVTAEASGCRFYLPGIVPG